MAQQGQAQQAPYAVERGDTVELGRVYTLKVGGRELIYHGDVNRMTRTLKATIYRHALVTSGRYHADELADADADLLADAFGRSAIRRDGYSFHVSTVTKRATGTARTTHDYSDTLGGGTMDLDTVAVVEVRAGQIVEPADDATANRYGHSFPAMTGDVVTEGHVKHCARHGHATWTADGVDKGTCPRCGEVTESKTELEELPATGHLNVYATADVITSASAAEGDADRRGYVSNLDGVEPMDARNDVAPLFSARLPLDDDERDELRRVVESLGAIDGDDGSTLYASDAVVHDYATDETWSYALHTFVKTVRGGKGVEIDVDPRDFYGQP